MELHRKSSGKRKGKVVSLIVSTFNDSEKLACLLFSLGVQTYQDFELIVTDNSNTLIQDYTKEICEFFTKVTGKAVTLLKLNYGDAYTSAEIGITHAKGEWLGFPSSDGYYMPVYLEAMVQAGHDSDLVYCDLVYDRRAGGRYEVMRSDLRCGAIDKTSFLIRKNRFREFPGKGPGSWSDWHLIDSLMKEGTLVMTKVNEVLVVHN
jgi:glycosyltransferase involved in cell wall biosynthesis